MTKHEYSVKLERALDTIASYGRPSVMFRPTLSLDGNAWCALYGDNLQEGIAGFGATPDAAMRAFDLAWNGVKP